MFEKYGDRVAFFVVYIREAHALDSPMPGTFGMIEDPIDAGERTSVANRCVADLHLPMPALVDGLDDAVNRSYGGWPDRLYLIGRDGRVAYAGGQGPFLFAPVELEAAIRVELARSAP